MKRLYLFYTLTFYCLGCDNVLDYNPPYTPKLVVNAFFAHDSLFTVAVSKNIPATNINIDAGIQGLDVTKNPHPAIENAAVDVYEDGKWIETLPYIPPSAKAGSQEIGIYRSKLNRGKSGQIYTLKVKAANYPDAEATAAIPKPVPVIDFRHKAIYEGKQKKQIDTQFVLDDDGLENYYMLSYEVDEKVDGIYKPIYGSGTNVIVTNDLVLKSGLNFFDRFEISNDVPSFGFLPFSNNLFRGKQQELFFQSIPFYFPMNEDERFLIQVMQINKDFYLNRYDAYTQAVGESDPFALPQRVHSNIKGGLGIFATYTIKTFYIQ